MYEAHRFESFRGFVKKFADSGTSFSALFNEFVQRPGKNFFNFQISRIPAETRCYNFYALKKQFDIKLQAMR